MSVNPHATAEAIVNEVEYFNRLQRAGVPEHLHEGLVRYLVHRIQPGHFLMAVLENNLTMAIARGDDVSCAGLPALIRFLVNDAPGDASGSPATVREWLGQLSGESFEIDIAGLERSVDRALTTIDNLRAQRDELLEALKKCRRVIFQLGLDPVDANYASILEQADLAIVLAEGR